MMDHKQSLDYRFLQYCKNTDTKFNKYDYMREGILNKVLPKILFRGNPTLVSFLQLIDVQFISMFKSIQSVEKYKHITNY